MKSVLIALTVGLLASFTSAAADPYAWSPALAGYYDAVAQHIHAARQSGTDTPPTCDLSKVSLPTAPTPLPSPAGLTLAHVAVGRGVQNYTCANSTASAKPTAIGAVASLFNATCLASNYPDLLSMIPNIALQMTNPPSQPSPGSANTLAPSDIALSGHHFFSTNTTPVFELDSSSASGSHLGVVVGKKNSNSTAPAGSAMGKEGNGAVAWLYLDATNKSQTPDVHGNIRIGSDPKGMEWKAIYRLYTAGGSPPKTCEGLPSDDRGFSVDYSSVYYFFKG